LANKYLIPLLGVIVILDYYFQLLLGHNTTSYDHSKNKPVEHDFKVDKRLRFVSLRAVSEPAGLEVPLGIRPV
jgi:hypothetical protein